MILKVGLVARNRTAKPLPLKRRFDRSRLFFEENVTSNGTYAMFSDPSYTIGIYLQK